MKIGDLVKPELQSKEIRIVKILTEAEYHETCCGKKEFPTVDVPKGRVCLCDDGQYYSEFLLTNVERGI